MTSGRRAAAIPTDAATVGLQRERSSICVVQWAIVKPPNVQGKLTRHRPNFARIGDKAQRDGNDFNFLRN